MSETEELKTRIETIRALSGQLRERNRTVKSLEEEMTATAPEHAWSFGKKHHYNLLKAELEDERRLALEDKYRLGSLSKDLFEDFNIVADKATPSVVYALNTSNGSTRWSYTLDAASNSIPAVDNLGQIHLCTKTGDYVVLSAEGELRYKEHLADSVDGSPTISEWFMENWC